jgi:hypothetical protein
MEGCMETMMGCFLYHVGNSMTVEHEYLFIFYRFNLFCTDSLIACNLITILDDDAFEEMARKGKLLSLLGSSTANGAPKAGGRLRALNIE